MSGFVRHLRAFCAWLAAYRLRMLFWSAFLVLAGATVTMALYVLREEKALGYASYRQSFDKTVSQIAARLRHPSGQLALLNPPVAGAAELPLRPMVLPFSALDFDDPNKVQQAIEMSGCVVQYPDRSNLCVAVGNNPWAGGYLYLAGSVPSAALLAHQRGERELIHSHRVRVSASLRGQTYRWIAPFEAGVTEAQAGALRGRLTGFPDDGTEVADTRPDKDFRGWIWQSPACLQGEQGQACRHRTLISVRLPVGLLRDALFDMRQPQWPPADLHDIRVGLQFLPPESREPIFDSAQRGATPPFSLNELQGLLMPGESLQIRKEGAPPGQRLVTLVGQADTAAEGPRWLSAVIRLLPVESYDVPLRTLETIATPLGNYEVVLTGDVRSVNRNLAAVASRLSWFVGAMLLAISLAWLVIELGIIRRIGVLTRRASRVSRSVKANEALNEFDVNDQRGADELGILASCLAELMQRVREDLRREQIRAEQERDMWHAVGHEIMSPLQSLMALHGNETDPSHRYISRMQQAVRVLYGSASPSEAIQASTLQLDSLDLCQFLRHVAENAPCAGIEGVRFLEHPEAVMVRADEYSLEDVVTHILRNADRYRPPATPITMALKITGRSVLLSLHNQGPAIPEALLDKIFEYGVSEAGELGSDATAAPSNGEHRGQGLFVVKTYMAKMGGTVTALNTPDGVSFVLSLPLA